ncbi:MAG: DUF2207 family protein [Acidimicrobiales bacterium]
MVFALSEAGQRAAALGIAAVVALAVWLVVLAVLVLATRPDLPPAAAAGSEFGGDESPAVVSLLVNRWELGHEAVPATLLDLAARKALSVDQVAPGRFVVRLRSSVPPGLSDYERQVLDHVRSLASEGGVRGPNAMVVPAEALTTGPEVQSKRWWKRFQKSVVAEARDRGLSRPRWSVAMLVALGFLAVGPALLASGALVAAPTEDASTSTSDDDDAVGGVLSLGAVAWGALMAIPFSLRQERDTAAGREAAARWLGLREYLDGDEAFDRAPPAAVAIWDRYLAYGAAMGVAAGAVRPLPLGSESDTEAWSSHGGHWHVVRVCYPVRFPPGWGQKPLVAAAKGAAVVAFGLLLAIQIGPPLVELAGEVLDDSRGSDWEIWARIGVAVAGAVAAVAVAAVVRGAVMLAYAVPDLFSTRETEGLVIRIRGTHLAVDDGQSRKVRAWRVAPLRLGPATRGAVVRVTFTPRLGYVSRIEPGRQGLGVDDAQMLEGPGQGDIEQP